MKIVVCGAGIGGLACAVRLAATGHQVTVLEQTGSAGGKVGEARLPGGHRFDTGPSLLTMPWVVEELFAETGAPAAESGVELQRVEPITRYGFADGSGFDLSGDLPVAMAELEAWSPGAGADWTRFLGTCASMWRASVPFLEGPPPWPPRRPAPGAAPPDPRDLLRVKPWLTLSQLARGHARDPRLRMVIERFATYAGADPRRAPAALAVAGYVEHAFGAWHVRGGLYRIVDALVARLRELGGELRLDTPVVRLARSGRRGRVTPWTPDGPVAAEVVVFNGDALTLERRLADDPEAAHARVAATRSVSGLAVMLALRGRSDGPAHHTIAFPQSYDAEFDDIFTARRPVREPTLYTSIAAVTDPADAPDDGGESWFVLTNQPAIGDAADWEAEADRVVARLGVKERVLARHLRTPGDVERETGAVGGAIYGAAAHGRLATVGRPGHRVRNVPNLLRVGGTVHPGGGLPLVMLGGRLVAREIGPA
jgi:phytoene desaturase